MLLEEKQILWSNEITLKMTSEGSLGVFYS